MRSCWSSRNPPDGRLRPEFFFIHMAEDTVDAAAESAGLPHRPPPKDRAVAGGAGVAGVAHWLGWLGYIAKLPRACFCRSGFFRGLSQPKRWDVDPLMPPSSVRFPLLRGADRPHRQPRRREPPRGQPPAATTPHAARRAPPRERGAGPSPSAAPQSCCCRRRCASAALQPAVAPPALPRPSPNGLGRDAAGGRPPPAESITLANASSFHRDTRPEKIPSDPVPQGRFAIQKRPNGEDPRKYSGNPVRDFHQDRSLFRGRATYYPAQRRAGELRTAFRPWRVPRPVRSVPVCLAALHAPLARRSTAAEGKRGRHPAGSSAVLTESYGDRAKEVCELAKAGGPADGGGGGGGPVGRRPPGAPRRPFGMRCFVGGQVAAEADRAPVQEEVRGN
eukprot:gene15322-biopygen4538